jgi:hypothetical protein
MYFAASALIFALAALFLLLGQLKDELNAFLAVGVSSLMLALFAGYVHFIKRNVDNITTPVPRT